MRYLLKEDLIKKDRLSNLKDKYFKYRQPNKLIQQVYASATFNIRDLEADIMSWNMCKDEKTDTDKYITFRMEQQRSDLLLNDIDIQFAINENDYNVRAAYYYASPTYINVLNTLESIKMLEWDAYEYLNQFSEGDSRNIVEIDGEIMLGKRGKNEYDAHWLGDFISYKFIMTSENYDIELKKIKDNATTNRR